MQRSEEENSVRCGECGDKIKAVESEIRLRLKQSKSGKLYCTGRCSAKAHSKFYRRVKSMRPEDFQYLAQRHEELQSKTTTEELIQILSNLNCPADTINKELRSIIFKIERRLRCQEKN